METKRTGKRLIALSIVTIVIALGYFVGPRVFDFVLAMHGL